MHIQVNIWDLAEASAKPILTLNHLDELSGAVSIAQHPTQSHVLLVGLNSGTLSVFDLRGGSSSGPTANLQQLRGGVNEVHFHDVSPDHFFTCSQAGDMIHWFPAGERGGPELVQSKNISVLFYCKLQYSLFHNQYCFPDMQIMIGQQT